MSRKSGIMEKGLPGWFSGTLIAGTFLSLIILERKRPLRSRKVESKARRDLRNLSMAALSALTIRHFEKPAVTSLARWVERRKFGVVKWMKLPPWMEVPLAVLLLDYTLYVWHVLTHKRPFLWRFHRVHHADLDMDASTALRFHFGEMLLSVPWRLLQVVLIGAGPLSLSIWQTLTLMEILFHHSNLRLPLGLERKLVRLIVTPRMHGIHHSIVESETNSNWSTIFTLPDRLHRTLKLNIPQQRITLGVPGYRIPGELSLGKLIPQPLLGK